MTHQKETCRRFRESSKLEWLETNGTGAFAMGTVAGVNTRRYHGLLVASLTPGQDAPAAVCSRAWRKRPCSDGRVLRSRRVSISRGGHAAGFELMEEFRPEPCATWIYGTGGTRLEKQVYLIEGRPAAIVRYRADRALTLRVRPFLAIAIITGYNASGEALETTALQFHSKAKFVDEPHWYYNVEYLEELDRGLDFREDLYTPGVLRLDLKPGQWTPFARRRTARPARASPSNAIHS